ncbi:LLM class flavin-dependent oxidoreductase [Halobellus sp. GM3]|uniref:LLM class flavin-dependent oxidoreductase n=1 Tax=Halobellus sp. GM3 TaxID=3458410 RepID=UPI00403D66A9
MEVHVFHLMPWTEVEDEVAWPFSDDQYDPDIGEELYQDYIDQLEYCEELGFDALALNEHHYSAYGLMPSPNLIATALADRTSDIKIGVYGNVLPLRGHPVRVAEETAMIDNISEGRLISGFVRGVPSEYAAYGVDPNQSRSRFEEAWALIIKAWTEEEPFDWDGEHYQYDDVYIWPRPTQDPHPPLWMPAESERSIRFAVERKVPIARTIATPQNVSNTFNQYRRIAQEEHNWTPGDEHFGISRMVYVGETDEAAIAESKEHIEYYYDKLLGGLYRSGAVKAVGDSEYREDNAFEYEEMATSRDEKGRKAMEADFDELHETGEVIVGSPETVIEKIEDQYEITGGFNRLITRFQFGTLSHEKAIENAERFADEVYPEIENL